MQLDARPHKYHAGPAELQQRLWWRLCRGCSADTGGPCLGSGSSLLGVFLFELGYGRERSKNMMSRSLRSGFGFVHGYVKQNCYGLRIFNFQPPQQCPVIVNQRQGVGQGDVDLHQGGGVIKRAKSFSRPRSISPNPLRCFIPLLVIRRLRKPHQHLLTGRCHRADLLWVVL